MNDRWNRWQTDGDETMMDSPGDDDAAEMSAANLKNPTIKAIGSRDCYPRSMWSLSVSRLVPHDGEHTKGATPFVVESNRV